jgi:ElaB/YqjD/DUF883 family membrane-anchored ribosome-binding protein
MTDTSTSVTQRVRDEGQSVGEAVQDTAAQAKEQGTRKLQSELDQRTTQAGIEARKLAAALRRSGAELGEGSELATRVASGAADRMERLGSYLEEARGEELLRDAERFARRMPWVVAGTAAAAGFAVSRFLKASAERRYEQRELPATTRGAGAV